MAMALTERLGGDEVEVRSAGSAPAEHLHPEVVAVMGEIGIDISAREPAVLSADDVRASDVVITMGCGDACPVFPGRRYEDWQVDDPAGRSPDEVRRIRDDIARRVRELLDSLGVSPAPESP